MKYPRSLMRALKRMSFTGRFVSIQTGAYLSRKDNTVERQRIIALNKKKNKESHEQTND